MSLTKVTIPDMVTGSLPFSRIESAPINVLDYGAVGDGVANDLTAIQAAIDAATAANKVVYFPAGTYRVTGPLVLTHNSSLTGENLGGGDYRALNLGGTIIELDSATPGTNLFNIDQSDLRSTFVWNIAIRNMSLTNSGTGGNGLNLVNVANSVFDNLFIEAFNYGVRISNGMLNTYNRVSVQLCGASSFYVEADNSTTTTQVFNECVARESDWGWIMASTATSYSIDTILNACLVESTKVGGISLHKSCAATFNDMYCENVPDDRVITNGSMFSLHKSGDGTVSPANSRAIFNGGNLAGGNFSLFSGSSVMDIGECNYIQVNGSILQRATYGIKCDVATTKDNSVYLSGPQFAEVTTIYENTAGKITGVYPNQIFTLATLSQASFGWVGVGQTQPISGQCARFQSTTSGVGLPQQTTAQRTNYGPPVGTLVFDTDLDKAFVFTTGGWAALN
jgi:hypothetical protein